MRKNENLIPEQNTFSFFRVYERYSSMRRAKIFKRPLSPLVEEMTREAKEKNIYP